MWVGRNACQSMYLSLSLCLYLVGDCCAAGVDVCLASRQWHCSHSAADMLHTTPLPQHRHFAPPCACAPVAQPRLHIHASKGAVTTCESDHSLITMIVFVKDSVLHSLLLIFDFFCSLLFSLFEKIALLLPTYNPSILFGINPSQSNIGEPFLFKCAP